MGNGSLFRYKTRTANAGYAHPLPTYGSSNTGTIAMMNSPQMSHAGAFTTSSQTIASQPMLVAPGQPTQFGPPAMAATPDPINVDPAHYPSAPTTASAPVIAPY